MTTSGATSKNTKANKKEKNTIKQERGQTQISPSGFYSSLKDAIEGVEAFSKNLDDSEKNVLLEFCHIAKNHHPKQRTINSQFYISEHGIFEYSFNTIVSKLLYCVTYRKNDRFEIQFENLKTQKDEAEIKKSISQLEDLILSSIEDMNIIHTLLTSFPAMKDDAFQDFKEKFTLKLMSMCLPALTTLYRLYADDYELKHDYYVHYQIINEKLQWIFSYIDEYQNQLIINFKTHYGEQSTSAEMGLHSLLLYYSKITSILWFFNMYDDLNKMEDKAIAFMRSLKLIHKPFTLLNKEEITNLEKIFRRPEKLEIQIEFSLCEKLDTFFNAYWSKKFQHNRKSEFDLEKCNDLVSRFSTLQSLNLQGIDDCMKSALNCLQQFTFLSKNELSKEIISTTFKLATQSFIVLKKYLTGKKALVLTSQSILKHIADDLYSQWMQYEVSSATLNSSISLAPQTQATSSKSIELLSDILKGVRITALPLENSNDQIKFEIIANTLRSQREKELRQKYKSDFEKESQNLFDKFSTQRNQMNEQYEKDKKTLEEEYKQKLVESQDSTHKKIEQEKEALNIKLVEQKAEHQDIFTKEINKNEVEHKKIIHTLQKKHKRHLLTNREKNAKVMEDIQYETQQKINNVSKEQIKSKKELFDNLTKTKREIMLKYKKEISDLNTQHKKKLNDTRLQNNNLFETMKLEQNTKIQNFKTDAQAQLNDYEEKLKKGYKNPVIQKPISKTDIFVKSLSNLQDFTQIASIAIPPEIQYILDVLNDNNLEYYITGGFIRNYLLQSRFPNLKFKEDGDIDVKVNALDLPLELKEFPQCERNILELRQYKLGRLDLWCQPWEDLKKNLEEVDFSINAFICFEGSIYDVLNIIDDLDSPFIRFLGDLNQRIEQNPMLLMRALRYPSQLHKKLSIDDIKVIKSNAYRIKQIPIGIYLKNLQEMFICPFVHQNFVYLVENELLHDIFPMLPEGYLTYISQHSPMLFHFWQYKLQEFASNPQYYNYYHILALFLLFNLLMQESQYSNLKDNLDGCFTKFTDSFNHSSIHKEKFNLQKKLEINILDQQISDQSIKSYHQSEDFQQSPYKDNTIHQGLFTQFKEYEYQNYEYMRNPIKCYTPGYQGNVSLLDQGYRLAWQGCATTSRNRYK